MQVTRLTKSKRVICQLPSLPAAVEVAAYRIVKEALTNVVRHSGANRCNVKIWLDNGLCVKVEDDGGGFPEDANLGVGLKSMQELTMVWHYKSENNNYESTSI